MTKDFTTLENYHNVRAVLTGCVDLRALNLVFDKWLHSSYTAFELGAYVSKWKIN